MLLIFKWSDNFPIFNPTFTRKFPFTLPTYTNIPFSLERLEDINKGERKKEGRKNLTRIATASQ